MEVIYVHGHISSTYIIVPIVSSLRLELSAEVGRQVEVDSSEKHCPWDTNFTDARCLDKDQKAWDEQIYATEDDCILMKNYSFQTYLKLSLFFVLFFT
ncbi:uncharacterized protein LOC111394475 isoform X2 [Olea europaea var. sylvestris]|uniref:uncharacterized protein LOC111394475 isoform X2 n=1 Tax=Olea europaea var. sylvestris TaxID=158386 RepID=UPI000C1D835B|nr:uncharacterized protein LOC111394475 isoform X2 [Olea europaea var. sylvestris]XP_022876085.1 uncharacterized protein LOC111394475 isoform X2 [Olea europaea var. sylvestris]